MASRQANGRSRWVSIGFSAGLMTGLMGGAIATHAAPNAAAPTTASTTAPTADDMTRLLLSEPPDLSLAQPGAILPDPFMVTANTISQQGLTIPSLWWARDQFGEQLLETWLVYPAREDSPQRVELVVNPQVWSIYNYMERYTFVNQFGASASAYGYSTRVFDRQGNLLAAYLCDFLSGDAGGTLGQLDSDRNCDIMLRSEGIAGLTGRPTPAAATQPTPDEIGQR